MAFPLQTSYIVMKLQNKTDMCKVYFPDLFLKGKSHCFSMNGTAKNKCEYERLSSELWIHKFSFACLKLLIEVYIYIFSLTMETKHINKIFKTNQPYGASLDREVVVV